MLDAISARRLGGPAERRQGIGGLAAAEGDVDRAPVAVLQLEPGALIGGHRLVADVGRRHERRIQRDRVGEAAGVEGAGVDLVAAERRQLGQVARQGLAARGIALGPQHDKGRDGGLAVVGPLRPGLHGQGLRLGRLAGFAQGVGADVAQAEAEAALVVGIGLVLDGRLGAVEAGERAGHVAGGQLVHGPGAQQTDPAQPVPRRDLGQGLVAGGHAVGADRGLGARGVARRGPRHEDQ